MRDLDKGHVPDYPAVKVTQAKYNQVTRQEQHHSQEFVWLVCGEVHKVYVSYDINGMAIGYVDAGRCFIFD